MAAYDSARDGAQSLNGSSPARDAVAVTTPSDTVDFTRYPRGFSVAVSGNVSVIPAAQQGTETAVVIYVAAGVPFPLSVRRINATGTTATGIVALY